MREIKFRGKSIDNGEWVYGDFFVGIDNDEVHYICPKKHYQGIKVDPDSIGQYTGLKDQNGVKIYEGDVLKNNKTSKIGFVAWHGTMAGFIFNKLPRDGFRSFEWGELFLSYMKCEIIGNIYENPELLVQS